jgi:hypothetical protein
VQRDTAAVRPRQAAYELDVGFPLLLEMVGRFLRVGIAIQVQVKLRVVGLEFRTLFTQEPVRRGRAEPHDYFLPDWGLPGSEFDLSASLRLSSASSRHSSISAKCGIFRGST